MFLRDLMRSILHRWYFVVVGLILTAALSFAGYRLVPVTYQISSSELMLPPKITVGPGGNPYLYLGGLGQALDVLSRRLQSDDVTKPVLNAHPGASFVAAPDSTTSGPILLITVKGKTPAETLATREDIVRQLPIQLKQLQDELNVPESSRLSVTTLAADTAPTPNNKAQLQSVLGIAAGGFAGTLLLTGLLDGMIATRRLKRAASSEEEPAESNLASDERSAGYGTDNESSTTHVPVPVPKRRRTRHAAGTVTPAEPEQSPHEPVSPRR